MMTYKLLISFIVLYACSAQAQDQNDSKALVTYFELAGPGVKYSINAEYPFYSKNKVTLNGRLGFGKLKRYQNDYHTYYYFWSIPVGISGYYGNRNGHLQVSVTATYAKGEAYILEKRSERVLFFPGIGYRYQRQVGGVFGSFMWNPSFEIKNYGVQWQWKRQLLFLGISVGYAFPLKK